jgi:hypothetical protein
LFAYVWGWRLYVWALSLQADEYIHCAGSALEAIRPGWFARINFSSAVPATYQKCVTELRHFSLFTNSLLILLPALTPLYKLAFVYICFKIVGWQMVTKFEVGESVRYLGCKGTIKRVHAAKGSSARSCDLTITTLSGVFVATRIPERCLQPIPIITWRTKPSTDYPATPGQ